MDKANLSADPSGLTQQQREMIARRATDTDNPGAGDRFRALVQKVVTVPKAELDRRDEEARHKK